jgi:site-specific recombinase XerD
MTALAPTLQVFFTERLMRQRQASPHTLAAYRDTLRLLLVFASAKRGIEPSKLDIGDLDAPLIGAFLDHLEKQRKNSARTRNARLAAVGSLFRYAALRQVLLQSWVLRIICNNNRSYFQWVRYCDIAPNTNFATEPPQVRRGPRYRQRSAECARRQVLLAGSNDRH